MEFNGKTLSVVAAFADVNTEDLVRCTEQELTEEKQAQARANIAAASQETVNNIGADVQTHGQLLNTLSQDAQALWSIAQDLDGGVRAVEQWLINLAGAVVKTTPQELTAEEQAQARANIGAAYQSDYGIVISRAEDNAEVSIDHFVDYDESGHGHSYLSFFGHDDDKVRLSRIADGEDDWDAATVGQLNAAVAGKGYKLLAETILTEDANEIIWTKTSSGEALSNYKDFFIYWVGKFDVAVKSQPWICRANDGLMYYCYRSIDKEDSACGFWWEIEEVLRWENSVMWKATYPTNRLVRYDDEFSYKNQGLSGACQQLGSDLCCITREVEIEKLHFGSLSTGSKMVAGSKAMLLGRKR